MDLSRSGIVGRVLRTRRLVRAPIWLYRARLGWLLGSRMLMLEHRGRRSGLARYVCLEVVDRPAPDRLLIASGFGARADWYQNLEADPSCRVSIGTLHRIPASARFLTSDEAAQVITRYQRAHPRAWEQLHGAIERAVGHPVQDLPMVELDLTLGPKPSR